MIQNQIICGNSVDVLKTLPDESISTVITSPPYFGLRSYGGFQKEIGQEASIKDFIANLCLVFDECHRVLRPDGGLWVNLGDCYSNNGNGSYKAKDKYRGKQKKRRDIEYLCCGKSKGNQGFPHKCLLQVPSRFAIEMTDNHKWLLRNSICWQKTNVMPESCTDRFTRSWEYLFFFVKSKRYYFDTQYEPASTNTICSQNPLFRIKRDVWSIPTARTKGKHYASYPERLVKTPILATCPEYICNSCGKPRVKIMEKVNNVSQADRTKCKLKKKAGEKRYEVNTAPSPDLIEKYKEVGLTDCGCGAKWNAGIVLDPFCGSGTSCVVAKRLGRRWIGIDLNPDYSRMARTRLDETSVSIPQSTPEPKVVMATYPAIEVDDGETF